MWPAPPLSKDPADCPHALNLPPHPAEVIPPLSSRFHQRKHLRVIRTCILRTPASSMTVHLWAPPPKNGWVSPRGEATGCWPPECHGKTMLCARCKPCPALLPPWKPPSRWTKSPRARICSPGAGFRIGSKAGSHANSGLPQSKWLSTLLSHPPRRLAAKVSLTMVAKSSGVCQDGQKSSTQRCLPGRRPSPTSTPQLYGCHDSTTRFIASGCNQVWCELAAVRGASSDRGVSRQHGRSVNLAVRAPVFLLPCYSKFPPTDIEDCAKSDVPATGMGNFLLFAPRSCGRTCCMQTSLAKRRNQRALSPSGR